MTGTTIQWLAAALFALALIHTFTTKFFEHLANTHPAHAGVWHLLGEVEIVFGVWAMLFVTLAVMLVGSAPALEYLDSRNFTEPLFVFAIMVVAASRPVLQAASTAVDAVVRALPLARPLAFYFTTLSVVPLLGSFITEPAAMTLAALLMRGPIFAQVPSRLKYATIGCLFVNVSIGGTLTPFAAPPVLMVAAKWGFDLPYMLTHIGWKAALAVFINAAALTAIYARTLCTLQVAAESPYRGVPAGMVALHLVFLTLIVLLSHHPAAFLSVFLLFMGVATAYPQHQDRLILREGLLVAFFLGGLVVLGGMQQWWLQPLLQSMTDAQVYFGATALTAITDNAALTYLGSLVDGLSDDFKYSLVTGAVTGGGLTVIANAPNPAGAAILKGTFREGAISPKGLFLGALGPTVVAILCFRLLPQ